MASSDGGGILRFRRPAVSRHLVSSATVSTFSRLSRTSPAGPPMAVLISHYPVYYLRDRRDLTGDCLGGTGEGQSRALSVYPRTRPPPASKSWLDTGPTGVTLTGYTRDRFTDERVPVASRPAAVIGRRSWCFVGRGSRGHRSRAAGTPRRTAGTRTSGRFDGDRFDGGPGLVRAISGSPRGRSDPTRTAPGQPGGWRSTRPCRLYLGDRRGRSASGADVRGAGAVARSTPRTGLPAGSDRRTVPDSGGQPGDLPAEWFGGAPAPSIRAPNRGRSGKAPPSVDYRCL